MISDCDLSELVDLVVVCAGRTVCAVTVHGGAVPAQRTELCRCVELRRKESVI